jgi:multidrug efflux pump subunit AcrA (membrane-fusion protein)
MRDRQQERAELEAAQRQEMNDAREKATRALEEEKKESRRQEKGERAKREAREAFAQEKREGEKERRMQRLEETESKERKQRAAAEEKERRQRRKQEAKEMRSNGGDYGDDVRPARSNYLRRSQSTEYGSDAEEYFPPRYKLKDYRKQQAQHASVNLGMLLFPVLPVHCVTRASFCDFLGGLGPNIGSDAHLVAKQKADRMRELAKRVHEVRPSFSCIPIVVHPMCNF